MLDKSKLIVLRNNIDNYLQNLEEKEDKKYNVFLESLIKLKKEIKDSIPDMNIIVKAIEQLGSVITKPKNNIYESELLKIFKKIEFSLTNKKEVVIPKIDDRTDEIIRTIKGIKLKIPEVEFPETINIGNFPPQKIPTPVTNININPLQGFIETTSVTVGTSITKLPDYGQLFNRRAVIVYNNSSNTIFIGGSEVTTSNGLPVPSSSYSPILDAGNTCIVYGVASQAGNNVRVLEISKDKSSTVQQ